MSAIDLLPADVVRMIRNRTPRLRLRVDLLTIPEAEAAGWRVVFPKGSWHNAATFERERVTVWLCGTSHPTVRMWWQSRNSDGIITEHTSLRAALGLSDK